MTTIAVDNFQGVQKIGNIYVAAIGTASVISDDTEEMLPKIEQISEEKANNLFGPSSTWTFVQSKFAENFDAAEQVVTGKFRLPPNTPLHHISHIKALAASNISKEAIDAYEWVRDNAKSKVTTWKYPLTNSHYYLFEDSNEAMLFKLSVAI